MRPLERHQEGPWDPEGTERENHRNGSRRRAAEKGAKQLDGSRVSPLEVVEHQGEWPPLRQMLEERADRAMAAKALVL